MSYTLMQILEANIAADNKHKQEQAMQLSLALDSYKALETTVATYENVCAAASSFFHHITPVMEGQVQERSSTLRAELLDLLKTARTGTVVDPCAPALSVRKVFIKLQTDINRLLEASNQLLKGQDVLPASRVENSHDSLIVFINEVKEFLKTKLRLWLTLDNWRMCSASLLKATLAIKNITRQRLADALAVFSEAVVYWESRQESADYLDLTTATPEEARCVLELLYYEL